jgi:aspartate-semialdehyde dehydrogenase
MSEGFRVAVFGASSLLGKELLGVLEERRFPISRLVTFEADEDEPELPIVDLRGGSRQAVADREVTLADLDFAFLAARPRHPPAFLSGLERGRAGRGKLPASESTGSSVIDLEGNFEASAGAPVLIPFLDRAAAARAGGLSGEIFVAPHPATIVLSTLLGRLRARFEIRTAAAQIFSPASGFGPRAIEELQKQTVNLLSFQKIPRQVFGAQLAFNLLPRLGRAERSGLTLVEQRVRHELREHFGRGISPPALKILQAPVFYSMAISLYVEVPEPASADRLAESLSGERVRLHLYADPAPSQAETSGTGDILVDAIAADPGRAGGFWIWAAVDNLRLAAENAVDIAEALAAARP